MEKRICGEAEITMTALRQNSETLFSIGVDPTRVPGSGPSQNYSCEVSQWLGPNKTNNANKTTTTTLQLLYDPLSGTTQVSRHQKDKPFWILLKQT